MGKLSNTPDTSIQMTTKTTTTMTTNSGNALTAQFRTIINDTVNVLKFLQDLIQMTPCHKTCIRHNTAVHNSKSISYFYCVVAQWCNLSCVLQISPCIWCVVSETTKLSSTFDISSFLYTNFISFHGNVNKIMSLMDAIPLCDNIKRMYIFV